MTTPLPPDDEVYEYFPKQKSKNIWQIWHPFFSISSLRAITHVKSNSVDVDNPIRYIFDFAEMSAVFKVILRPLPGWLQANVQA